ncbi:fibroblast growth factor 17-like isoform X1 [Asterias rubens]|uniref:fibroblast growth factor 17-like isoform X1 n=1 Tax=Asterias rubens TaxID=7604 RepID=UPI0014556405|nr:fibroblast growth factor 17-like isoform X1 [Asterias rubens]
MQPPLYKNSCFMIISWTTAMFVEKRLLSILLHIIIIWCLSIQESVQLAYGNNFERGMTGLDRNNSVSAPIHLQLYNRNSNKHLRIQERDIDAMGEDGEAYARIIIRTDSFDGWITIQGEESQYYLCMNKKGDVVGRKKLKMTSGVCCLFTETIVDDYTEFKPVQRTEMYLGFNRDGGAVSARYRTRSGARAFQFLKRPLPEDRPPDDESPEPYSWVHLLIQANTESSKDKTDS